MASFFHHKKSKAPEVDNPYWMSFSDMMSAMLIIFILVCFALLLRISPAEKKIAEKMDEIVQREEKLALQIKSISEREAKLTLEINKLSQERDSLAAEKLMISQKGDKLAADERKLSVMRQKVNDSIEKARTVRLEIVNEIARDLKEQNILVTFSDNKDIVHISTDTLNFDDNRYEIKKEFQNTARQIGIALLKSIEKPEHRKYLDTVFVEGHTDSRHTSFPGGNWGLSARRAISLWEFWADNKIGLDKIVNIDDKPLFSVSGYADTRRIVPDEKTDDDYRKNRRIDIRFTTRQPSKIDENDLAESSGE